MRLSRWSSSRVSWHHRQLSHNTANHARRSWGFWNPTNYRRQNSKWVFLFQMHPHTSTVHVDPSVDWINVRMPCRQHFCGAFLSMELFYIYVRKRGLTLHWGYFIKNIYFCYFVNLIKSAAVVMQASMIYKQHTTDIHCLHSKSVHPYYCVVCFDNINYR